MKYIRWSYLCRVLPTHLIHVTMLRRWKRTIGGRSGIFRPMGLFSPRKQFPWRSLDCNRFCVSVQNSRPHFAKISMEGGRLALMELKLYGTITCKLVHSATWWIMAALYAETRRSLFYRQPVILWRRSDLRCTLHFWNSVVILSICITLLYLAPTVVVYQIIYVSNQYAIKFNKIGTEKWALDMMAFAYLCTQLPMRNLCQRKRGHFGGTRFQFYVTDRHQSHDSWVTVSRYGFSDWESVLQGVGRP